jgi:catechol 2,3-dioxygenase-like lactoylglutathione lyase family enzyme
MDETTNGVQRIASIALVVADMAAARAFYEQALGFSALQSANGGTVLVLGAQRIALESAGPQARPYPEPRAANDPWLQHFAIAVSDMAAAYARLSLYPQQPISDGGPQLLPPSSGSVTAYKFRDPDGHPLELSHIPGSAWDHASAPGPFLGVDHTALAVRDLEASIAFYKHALGFAIGGRFLNRGPEQDRLDGLCDVALDIVVLTTPGPGPHIELLNYRRPVSTAAPVEPRAGDIAATRTVMEAFDIQHVKDRLTRNAIPWVAEGEGLRLRDPDGHLIEIRAAPPL